MTDLLNDIFLGVGVAAFLLAAVWLLWFSLTWRRRAARIPGWVSDGEAGSEQVAAGRRAAGSAVEVYPETKKLGQQLKYADKKGFRIALVAGEDELANGRCQVKDLASGERYDVSLEEVVGKVREVLGGEEGRGDGGTEGRRDGGTEGTRE